MTAKTKKIYRFYLTVITLLAVALAALRTAALLRDYEPAVGYFKDGSLLVEVTGILGAASLVLAFSAVPVLGRRLVCRSSGVHLPSAFSSALTAFLLLAFAALHAVELTKLLRAEVAIDPRISVSSLAAILFACLGASGFILSASGAREASPRRSAMLSCSALFAVIYALYLYFESSMQINAPNKLLSEIALLAVAVFLLQESRVALGRPLWASRMGTGMMAMLLTASSAIPNLIYYVRRRESLVETPVHDFLFLAFFLYIFTRLVYAASSSSDPRDAFFSEALAASEEEESVSSIEQISFFAEPAADQLPHDGTSRADDPAAALLTDALPDSAADPTSEEAQSLFGAPPEHDLLEPIEGDLLGGGESEESR